MNRRRQEMAVVGVGVAVVGVGFTHKTPSERVSSEGVFEHFPDADDRSRLQGCGQGFSRDRIRCASPGRMEPAPAAKVPRGIGPERIGPQGRFGRRSSSPAGAARRCRCRGRAYRSPKSLPGRAPAVKRPSAPGYHPHRLRHGTESPTLEVPLPRCYRHDVFSSESDTPRRGLFLNEACSSKRRSASHPPFPENLRPSTRHRDPILPSILTSTKQRISKTAKRGVSKTRRQHNRKTAQQRVCKTAQQENKRAMNSRRQDFSTSVRTEVSPSVLTSVIQSVRQSVRTDCSPY